MKMSKSYTQFCEWFNTYAKANDPLADDPDEEPVDDYVSEAGEVAEIAWQAWQASRDKLAEFAHSVMRHDDLDGLTAEQWKNLRKFASQALGEEEDE